MFESFVYPEGYAARSAAELELALASVPAYRAWRTFDPGPKAPLDTRFAALPLLDKGHLRAAGLQGFVAPGHDLANGLSRGTVDTARTSGTTDEQVVLTWNQAWWDASEAASWTLNRHTAAARLADHPEAILSSPLSTGYAALEGAPLPLARRRLGRFLYLNEHLDATAWTEAHIRRMAQEMASFAPVVLEANPTLLARFARRLLELGLHCHPPQLIVLSFEFPSLVHLRQIRLAFDVPVVSSHGCTEAGCVLTQCEQGCFHQNAEFVRIEFQPLAERFGKPSVGRIALTTFGNPWRVLLRFDVGDLVRLRPANHPCPCGRTGGVVVDALEGRVRDATFDHAGNLVTVHELDRRLASIEGLLEYQVRQTGPQAWTARVVGEGASVRPEVAAALDDLYGGTVEVEPVAAIPAESSGKHRLAACEPAAAAPLFEGEVRAP